MIFSYKFVSNVYSSFKSLNGSRILYRSSAILIRYQVAPAELEALLLTHPDVADVAVVGMPDDEAGEVPKAFVVAKTGSVLTAERVKTFVAGGYADGHQNRFWFDCGIGVAKSSVAINE